MSKKSSVSRLAQAPRVRNLADMYESVDDTAMSRDIEQARNRYQAFVDKRLTYSQQQTVPRDDPQTLAQALKEYSDIQAYFLLGTQASTYFWLLSCIEYNPANKGAQATADEESRELQRSIQFFELSVQAIAESTQDKLRTSPLLQPYIKFLNTLWKAAPHALSQTEEKLLTYTYKGSYEMRTQMVEDAISQESVTIEDKTYTMSDVSMIITQGDHPLRMQLIQELGKIYTQHAYMASVEINAVLEYKKTMDTLRHFPRADSQRHLRDDITTQAVDSLVVAVTSNNHMTQEWYGLRNKVLGIQTASYHDRSLIYQDPTISLPSYTFEEAVALILEVMNEYDKDFSDFFRGQIEQGRIDVSPRQGKRSGAFHVGLGKKRGGFVLINHTNDFNSMMTLAHEIGHAYHTYLTGTHQDPLYYQYSMLCAEVASTTMEELMFRHLLKTNENELIRIQLLWKKSLHYVASVHRQIALYRYEQAIHKEYRQQGYVPKNSLNTLFREMMESYMGNQIQWDNGADSSWVTWTHIRTYFYVYAYAGAQLLASSIADQLQEDPSYRSVYKENLLQVGSSRSQVAIFQSLQRDITTKKTWKQGMNSFADILKQLQAYHS